MTDGYFTVSNEVVLCSRFLEMPLESQALYFHFLAHADNRGIVRNKNALLRGLEASNGWLHWLYQWGFIKRVPDDENIIEITHWRTHATTEEQRKKRLTYEYRSWRSKVISRDGKCLLCGSEENLEAHHIKKYSEYPELRYDVSNGATLCHRCHKNYHKMEKEGRADARWRSVTSGSTG